MTKESHTNQLNKSEKHQIIRSFLERYNEKSERTKHARKILFAARLFPVFVYRGVLFDFRGER